MSLRAAPIVHKWKSCLFQKCKSSILQAVIIHHIWCCPSCHCTSYSTAGPPCNVISHNTVLPSNQKASLYLIWSHHHKVLHTSYHYTIPNCNFTSCGSALPTCHCTSCGHSFEYSIAQLLLPHHLINGLNPSVFSFTCIHRITACNGHYYSC
jgi:hypothetical protein